MVEVANGVQQPDLRYPCWNPVLFQPERGPLLLFYKVGPTPSTWWGMLTTSTDGGVRWSKPSRLPDGILDQSRTNRFNCVTAQSYGSSTEHAGWRVHMERTSDLGKTWQKTDPLERPQ